MGTQRRRRWLVISTAALAIGVLLLFLWWRRGSGLAPSEPSLVSPYQNVLPGVRYVGDETCAQCHPSQAASYRQHPMSRSLAPLARSEPLERYDSSAHNPFESLGFQF